MEKLIVMVICALFLTGCTSKNLENVNGSVESMTFDLVSDRTTGIIYIKNLTRAGYFVYTPYYSENGKLCKLVDNKIVEINEEEARIENDCESDHIR